MQKILCLLKRAFKDKMPGASLLRLLLPVSLLVPGQACYAQDDVRPYVTANEVVNVYSQADAGEGVAPVYGALRAAKTNQSNTAVDASGVQTKIKIYPDPVTDYLLVVTEPVQDHTNVSVMSLIGTVLITDSILPGATAAIMDVKNIPHGIYILVFENKNDKQVMKFIKS